MEFKSQICTSVEQSKRLLELGLKKETADMALVENWDWNEEDGMFFTGEYFERPIDYVEGLRDKWIPAWSLNRLLEMLYADVGECIIFFPNTYDEFIADIENYIRRGIFNPEYLEEKK